jgi:hypothetical protein
MCVLLRLWLGASSCFIYCTYLITYMPSYSPDYNKKQGTVAIIISLRCKREASIEYEHCCPQRFFATQYRDPIHSPCFGLYAIGSCRTGLSWYIGWRAGTTTLCHSRLYPPVRDYEFGYRTVHGLSLVYLRLFIEEIFRVGHPAEA